MHLLKIIISEKEAHQETIANTSIIECASNSAYLIALHIPSRKLVHLDVSASESRVTTNEDAIRMKIYLDKLILITKDESEIPWKVLNQGQIVNLLSDNIVNDPEEADIIYDENTNSDEITRLITIC